MNRDLSYLLEEDHAPPKQSRLPFVLGGLLLAAVAGFFAMRGGKTPTPTATDETAAVSEPATEKPRTPAATARPKQEKPAPVTEPATSDAAPGDNAAGSASEAKSLEAATDETKPATEAPATTPSTTPPQKSPPVKTPAPRAVLAPKPTKPAALSTRKPSPSPLASDPPAEEAPENTASVAASSDCDKVPALRKAADRGDIKARTSLGLVYYSGQCVPRDLPTAYRWYALALHANPDNTQLSAQLEAIWKQMSPAERQLAIRPQP
jgi:hypothetical protein